MQKYLFLFLASFFFTSVTAQETLDSNGQKENVNLKDLHWIKDTAFGVFKGLRFQDLKVMYPSFKTYKKFIDTSVAGDQSDVTKYAMYNRFWNRLRIQYFKLHKKTKKAGIKWEKTELDSFYIDTGGIDGNEFAYMYWVIKYNNKKKFLVSALFLKMGNKWFLMDEIKYEGIIIEKKKKRKKR